jgi:hypothetical protein
MGLCDRFVFDVKEQLFVFQEKNCCGFACGFRVSSGAATAAPSGFKIF